jgi:uncharacterized protein (DUF1015 family)
MRIMPFRGYRYAQDGARDVSPVVAPPYDQISPEIQARLYAMSPANIVRASYPRAEPGADPYRASRSALDRWLADGVWRRDPEPALYPYHQSYAVGEQRLTRRGFVALGEVTPYAAGVVRPHERTEAAPKADRLRLLEATGADLGLLFMLASDPAGALLEAVTPTGEPVAEARDLRGEVHRLWRVTDPAVIGRVQTLMADRSVIIADGHHRYETAVEYARQHPDRPGARAKLMAFFAPEAPGLTILPNHRLVRALEAFSLGELRKRAAPWFEVGPLPDPLAFRPAPRRFAVVAGAEAVTFALRDAAAGRIGWPPGTSAAWRGLAVAILHEGLLRPLLGIDDARLAAGRHVAYTADPAEAVARARAGEVQAAFLIAPTRPDELLAVVRGGEVLPPKSTHFYPKLLDGLVFHRLDEPAG